MVVILSSSLLAALYAHVECLMMKEPQDYHLLAEAKLISVLLGAFFFLGEAHNAIQHLMNNCWRHYRAVAHARCPDAGLSYCCLVLTPHFTSSLHSRHFFLSCAGEKSVYTPLLTLGCLLTIAGVYGFKVVRQQRQVRQPK